MSIKFKNIRGKILYDYNLAKIVRFKSGGPAKIAFQPHDIDDLKSFLNQVPADIPILTIGAGSNVIINDKGIEGIVIKLGKNFSQMHVQNNQINIGAAALDMSLAAFANKQSISGLEFLMGIPGTIGGGIKMNAGDNITEIKDVLVNTTLLDRNGKQHLLTQSDLDMAYRSSNIPDDWIVINATFQGEKCDQEIISQNIAKVIKKREATQPIRAKTCGSSFKNPVNNSAWKLIKQACCDKLQIGDAKVSEKHCNFIINSHQAKSSDIKMLGEEIIKKVQKSSNITLEWEIKFI